MTPGSAADGRVDALADFHRSLPKVLADPAVAIPGGRDGGGERPVRLPARRGTMPTVME